MRRQRRRGFTLVELLVAMALTVFIMMILTQAFGTGMETFRTLRSVGALQSDLRNAVGLLKGDLDQSHFEGARRMSDAAFWQSPVKEGFFYISGGSVVFEGTGTDNIPSNTGVIGTSNVGPMLHFARRAKGNRKEDYTLASVSASCPLITNPTAASKTNICQLTADAQFIDTSKFTLASQWSEIAWFLKQKTSAVPGLYSLYRTELLVVADNAIGAGFTDKNLSTSSSQLLTAANLANGTFGFSRNSPTLDGATLVVDNVLSFRVQVIRPNDPDFVDVLSPIDTGNASNNQPIKAIRVTIRVCDPANETTRQISMIQEL